MPRTPLSQLGEYIEVLQGTMSEQALADKISLSRNQLRNIKTGKTGTSHETLGRLSVAFNLDAMAERRLFDLAGMTHPNNALTEAECIRRECAGQPKEIERLRLRARINYHMEELRALIQRMNALDDSSQND